MVNLLEQALLLLVERPELYFYIICGIWVLDLIYEAKRRKGFLRYDDDWDFDITTLLKIITSISCASGVFISFIGTTGLILGLVTKTVSYVSLIVLGTLTCLKPLNDLPIASIIGLLASIAVGIVMAIVIHFARMIIPFEISDTMLIVLIGVLVVIFIIVALIAKLWLLPLELISKIVSWPVVGIIGALYSLVLGLMLTIGITI